MKRRTFLWQSAVFSAGYMVAGSLPARAIRAGAASLDKDLYGKFRIPDLVYHPFVRWWWNGDKIEVGELVRELKLLKEAGIGGVEINPIRFPSREKGDDLGKPSLQWLGNEWINMLQSAFDEAGQLGLTCDLIVGSGWPFGAETLERDERAQVVVLDAEVLEGPMVYETSRFNLFKAIDPGVTVPYPGRTMELISLKLVPDPVSGLDQVTDLSDKCGDEVIRIDVREGKYVLYALIKVDSFASVINGAPGASGPILDHMNRNAVRKYLDHMSDTIQAKTGPVSKYLRAFFTDSMELEGCNWTTDFAGEFEKRRGYDLMPYLPFILFKVGRLGSVIDDQYGAAKTPAFSDILTRVRFDFEWTKAELLNERFTQTYLQWCRDLHVKSRAQAYGRGFFPLESSLGYDIPEGESWTTNWLRHKIGEEMPDDDYRRGRGYTMINKYVSSAAHLTGKREVSCEEMTNTYRVFNTSLEFLKIGSDQSIMSGVTHSVWHGFNYSPPDAPFPGWIQYGSYYNENNTWWPYFKYLNAYKARISALLENAAMFTDIAILPANNDMWGEMGVQTDPFPEKLNVPYTSLIWESICKNGGAADYTSEIIIRESDVRNGKLCYGPKQYNTLFLVEVNGINPETLAKLYEFVSGGGRVFCIEKYPEKSLGLPHREERDKEVKDWIGKLNTFNDRFILLLKPIDNRFLEWYSDIMAEYKIPHYLEIGKPDRFVMQNRYQSDDRREIIFFANAHKSEAHVTTVGFSEDIVGERNGWIWDPETGTRYRIRLGRQRSFDLVLGPAESRIFVFDREADGKEWKPVPFSGNGEREISGTWDLEFMHCRKAKVDPLQLDALKDLKDVSGYADFAGTIIYRNKVQLSNPLPEYLNLGTVYGISDLKINGQPCGVKWYGYRVYEVAGLLNEGENELEVRVTTVIGNYVKSLTDNPTAQLWTNRPQKAQEPSLMGMIGPVRLYGNLNQKK